MARKKTTKRLEISMSKKQLEWIDKTAKKIGTTKSKLICKLIMRSLDNLAKKLPEDDLNELIRIAKTPWLSFPEDEDL